MAERSFMFEILTAKFGKNGCCVEMCGSVGCNVKCILDWTEADVGRGICDDCY
jgi:hypothetical protein